MISIEQSQGVDFSCCELRHWPSRNISCEWEERKPPRDHQNTSNVLIKR